MSDGDVSLREYVDRRFADNDATIKAALASQEKAVDAALAAQEKAVQVAEQNAERWRMSANEWRAAMNDRERQFPTRKELWGYLTGLVFLVGTIAGVIGFLMRAQP